MKRTLYDVLGVAADATPEEIARAYEDRMAEATARQADPGEQTLLKEAYSILSGQNQREAYDASLQRHVEAATQLASNATVDVEMPRRWPFWLIGAIVIGGIAYFWPGGKPAAPEPVVIDRVVVMNAETPAPADVSDAAPPQRSEKSAEELFAQLAPSTAMVLAKQRNGYSQGSAVVIGPSRLITNCHVTKSSNDIQIRISDEIYDARVGTADEEFDLCTLEVLGLEAPAVAIGSVANLHTGQKVLALGAPRGLELTISEGIVSSLRKIDEGTIIQTTAPISPGSSGGGLFNSAGELVGIMTLTHRYGQNLNFAVPADWIGEMSNRTAAPRTGRNATGESDGQRDAGTTLAASERILGRWHCFRPDFGRHVDLEFQRGGRVIGTMLGEPLAGRYSVTETLLSLYDAKSWNLRIEELSERRMVLTESRLRIACDRL